MNTTPSPEVKRENIPTAIIVLMKRPHPHAKFVANCEENSCSWLRAFDPQTVSMSDPWVKKTPVAFKMLPSCAVLDVDGLYEGQPKSSNPCEGLRAKATQAACMYFERAISSVVGGAKVLVLYVPNTSGISEAW